MNRIHLRVGLYSAKKKESNLIDLSALSEAEKIALLNAYKRNYENQKLSFDTLVSYDSEEEIEEISEIEEIEEVEEINEVDEVDEIEEIDEINNVEEVEEVKDIEDIDNVEEVEEVKDIDDVEEVEEVKNIDDVEDVEEVEDIDDVEEVKDINDAEDPDDIPIEIEVIDEAYDNDEVANENKSKFYSGIPLQLQKNEDENSKKDTFDYSSFTPYKPKFDDIELNNNLYSMGDMGIKVSVSADEHIDKYVPKTVNKASNVKLSQNGSYKIADSYSSSKYKLEIPYLQIIICILATISLGIFVTQFIYHYDKIDLQNYLCDLIFSVSAFCLFMITINKAEIFKTFYGISLVLCLGFDLIFNGLKNYKEAIYMIVADDSANNIPYGIVILVGYIAIYLFFAISAVSSLIGKEIFSKLSTIIGVIAFILIAILFVFGLQNGKIFYFYDIIPTYAGLFTLVMAITISEYKKLND